MTRGLLVLTAVGLLALLALSARPGPEVIADQSDSTYYLGMNGFAG